MARHRLQSSPAEKVCAHHIGDDVLVHEPPAGVEERQIVLLVDQQRGRASSHFAPVPVELRQHLCQEHCAGIDTALLARRIRLHDAVWLQTVDKQQIGLIRSRSDDIYIAFVELTLRTVVKGRPVLLMAHIYFVLISYVHRRVQYEKHIFSDIKMNRRKVKLLKLCKVCIVNEPKLAIVVKYARIFSISQE